MATRKKTSTKKAAKKPAAKQGAPRKSAAKPVRKMSSRRRAAGTLHKVARSIGSTLGTVVRKTGKAVEAAKSALPAPLGSSESQS